ncbi:DUF2922 domain-containing protein [Vagococcus zengguangii]|uniref:DUF2922 domain-containing protein n=1 Tax=Vagococcus zengguangii TaxID=2571750 RepID=A0A4D7CS04_9ENTE|nr:DUF2922 domain-containing protein [Vagococcus zengguangii]QCI86995.1 DUF2922 domain-containing protein [Vagococcus zengguangii]
MKKLRMNFISANDKKTTFTYTNCHQELSADQVQAAMDSISQLKLISANGVLQYETPESANYIETIVTDIL